MSRLTGPRLKVMRALGTTLPGLSRKSIENRDYPPGQHGQKKRRRSDFALRLVEKQKLRFNYGLTETQIRKLFREAKNSKAPTGEKLLELLERRLDNAVFRAGFAPTGIAARQLVSHRHVLLNGRSVNIPSIRIKPGDVITLTEKGRRIPSAVECIETPELERPEWIAFDPTTASARITRVPHHDEVPFPVEVQHVVEFYAVRM